MATIQHIHTFLIFFFFIAKENKTQYQELSKRKKENYSKGSDINSSTSLLWVKLGSSCFFLPGKSGVLRCDSQMPALGLMRGLQERKMSELLARPWVGVFLRSSEPWAQKQPAISLLWILFTECHWDDGIWVSCAFIGAPACFLITCPVFSTWAFFFFLWHHLKVEPWFLPHRRMIQNTRVAFLLLLIPLLEITLHQVLEKTGGNF